MNFRDEIDYDEINDNLAYQRAEQQAELAAEQTANLDTGTTRLRVAASMVEIIDAIESTCGAMRQTVGSATEMTNGDDFDAELVPLEALTEEISAAIARLHRILETVDTVGGRGR